MNLIEQFEKETENYSLSPGIDIYNNKYIKWLEKRLTDEMEKNR